MVSEEEYGKFSGWVDSEGNVNYWEVKGGGKLKITGKHVYLPEEVGPVKENEKITKKLIDGYDVTLEYHNSPRKVFIPFFISGALFLYTLLSGSELAGIALSTGVVFFIFGLIAMLRELNTEEAETVFTIHLGRDSETVRIEGDEKETIEEKMSNIIN